MSGSLDTFRYLVPSDATVSQYIMPNIIRGIYVDYCSGTEQNKNKIDKKNHLKTVEFHDLGPRSEFINVAVKPLNRLTAHRANYSL